MKLITAIVKTFKLVNVVAPLRVSAEDETNGLDLTEHDERGYDI